MEKVTDETKLDKEKNIEKCVICGKETGYTYNVSIGERQFYIEGAGQLCEQCYYELYVKNNR
ncbi:MAG: hypothetical protein IJD77_06370 [Clostridia bacterium]|nr:hypothetical protein [Clostridia bacterium]